MTKKWFNLLNKIVVLISMNNLLTFLMKTMQAFECKFWFILLTLTISVDVEFVFEAVVTAAGVNWAASLKSFTSQNSASPFGLCTKQNTTAEPGRGHWLCFCPFLLAIRRQPLSLEWLEEPRSDRLFYEDFFMGTEKLDSRVPSVALFIYKNTSPQPVSRKNR